MAKICYMDLETTGLDPIKNGIHQIGMIAEIDGEVVDVREFKVRPMKRDTVEISALAVSGINVEDLDKYPTVQEIKPDLERWLGRFVNKFKREDKFTLAGYNIRTFDIPFLREWFTKQNDHYFGSWFNNQPIDVLALAYWLRHLEIIPELENYKLVTLCKFAEIELGDAAHDAIADIEATRELSNWAIRKLTLWPEREAE